jgi:hypothetical protein
LRKGAGEGTNEIAPLSTFGEQCFFTGQLKGLTKSTSACLGRAILGSWTCGTRQLKTFVKELKELA